MLLLAAVPGLAQAGAGTTTSHEEKGGVSLRSQKPVQAASPVPSSQGTTSNSPSSQCADGPCKFPEAHISVIDPPVVAAPIWSRHDRILWGAELVLALLGYVGIVVAVGTLKTIKRQIDSIEKIGQAVIESANAATLIGRTMISSQRPWILMSVERSKEAPETFNISATNCGRTPAEIIDCPDRVNVVLNDKQLPTNRGNAIKGFGLLSVPIMLLPGESTIIQRFGRDDLKWVCKSEESRKKVERKEETIFIYGSVIYREPAVSDFEQVHRTDWCCRYVHGETSSSLLIDGPPDYNKHL
jgi:hypothetical protein